MLRILTAALCAVLLCGCAVSGEYKVPLALDNGTWDEIAIEPDKSGDRGLFCLQAGLSVVCYFGTAEGKTYYFSFPQVETDEYLAPEAGT